MAGNAGEFWNQTGSVPGEGNVPGEGSMPCGAERYLCFYICKEEADSGRRLCGARFALKGADGSEQQSVSDCSGRVRFHALPCVEYELREIEPPPGYRVSPDVRRVRLDEKGALYMDGEMTRCVRITNQTEGAG